MDGRRRRTARAPMRPRAVHVDTALAAIAWSDPNPNATQKALQGAFADRARLDDDRVRRVLVGAEVERVVVRRTGHVDLRRAGDGDARATTFDADRRSGRRRSRRRQACAAPRLDCAERCPARRLPDDLAAVALVMLEDQVRPDAEETLGVLRRAGRDAQGDLRRQPAHRRRGRSARRPRGRGDVDRRAQPARRTSKGSPTRSSAPRCSAGSHRTRSGRWSRRCSRAGTSSR